MYFVLFYSALAQSWFRRAYYDDTRCEGALSVGISLPASYSCAQTSPFRNTCEVKGQDPYKTGTLKSSEASGCMSRDGAVTDTPWVPTASEGALRSGANYMTVNAYTDTSCAPSALYEQDMFLADGRCYAVEFETSFFRATCDGGVGTLSVFNDPLCQDCTNADLYAGMFQVTSFSGDATCINTPSRGISFKVICSIPGGGAASSNVAPGVVCPAQTASISRTTTTSIRDAQFSSSLSDENIAGTTAPTGQPETPGSGNGNVNSNSEHKQVASSLVQAAGLAAVLLL